jgi:hypothetical protein
MAPCRFGWDAEDLVGLDTYTGKERAEKAGTKSATIPEGWEKLPQCVGKGHGGICPDFEP